VSADVVTTAGRVMNKANIPLDSPLNLASSRWLVARREMTRESIEAKKTGLMTVPEVFCTSTLWALMGIRGVLLGLDDRW
jgi:hypothetical protein